MRKKQKREKHNEIYGRAYFQHSYIIYSRALEAKWNESIMLCCMMGSPVALNAVL
jgi:hypothetical protein